MRRVAEVGCGAVVYLRRGRSIGLINKFKAYRRRMGRGTTEANEALGFLLDVRDYVVAAEIQGAQGVGG